MYSLEKKVDYTDHKILFIQKITNYKVKRSYDTYQVQ